MKSTKYVGRVAGTSSSDFEKDEQKHKKKQLGTAFNDQHTTVLPNDGAEAGGHVALRGGRHVIPWRSKTSRGRGHVTLGRPESPQNPVSASRQASHFDS